MKTRLEGKWPKSGLYPDFTPYVAKYADNGRTRSTEDLKKYFREYRERAPSEYLRHSVQDYLARTFRSHVEANTGLYQFVRRAWWGARGLA